MDVEEFDDGCLVAKVLAGDTSAFASLYRRHAAAVRRVVAETTYDREAVADLVQEVFAKAIESLTGLREQSHFRSWVLTIARHAAIDHGRTQRRASPLDAEGQPEPVANDPEPYELAELAAMAERVRGCIAGLSVRDATVLSLATQLGYSPAELGQALGITSGAAKVVLHRARRRLRESLALTMLANYQYETCPEFRKAHEAGRLRQAGAHVESCPSCRAAVNTEVQLFQAGPSRPTTRIPDRSRTSANMSGSGHRSVIPNPATSCAP